MPVGGMAQKATSSEAGCFAAVEPSGIVAVAADDAEALVPEAAAAAVVVVVLPQGVLDAKAVDDVDDFVVDRGKCALRRAWAARA